MVFEDVLILESVGFKRARFGGVLVEFMCVDGGFACSTLSSAGLWVKEGNLRCDLVSSMPG